jgi:hypothetical protein
VSKPVRVTIACAAVLIALAAAAPAATAPPLTLTIAEFRASPPVGQTARIVGYVVESYFCPPCPRGAQCKACATASAIFVADAPGHTPFALDRPPTDVIAIATPERNLFERGTQYRFEIAVTDRKRDHFDGRLLRSQRPDREPIWIDSPAAPPPSSRKR